MEGNFVTEPTQQPILLLSFRKKMKWKHYESFRQMFFGKNILVPIGSLKCCTKILKSIRKERERRREGEK